MKNHIFVMAAISSLFLTATTGFPQGSLTPPGAPAATMKSLDQIEPRKPISSLPFTIISPGSYYVTTNLTGISGQPGITISVGNVTLDLKGFTLQGVPGSGSGVFVPNSITNIAVRDGVVSGWGASGVDAYSVAYPRNMTFEKLTVSGNGQYGIETEAGSEVRDCLSINNVFEGIFSAGGEITGCLARGNGNNGFDVYSCSLHECRAEFNGNAGLILNQSSATDCQSQNNSNYGFSLLQSTAIDCLSQFNPFDGFDLETGANVVRGCKILNNGYGILLNGNGLISDNYITGSSFTGISVMAAGCQILGNNIVSNPSTAILLQNCSGCRIDNNNIVTSSGNAGIFLNGLSCTNNVITRNNVIGDGAANYNIQPGNDLGPIGTAATSTSPWANFSR